MCLEGVITSLVNCVLIGYCLLHPLVILLSIAKGSRLLLWSYIVGVCLLFGLSYYCTVVLQGSKL